MQEPKNQENKYPNSNNYWSVDRKERRPRGNQRFGKDSSWKKRIRYTWEENNNVM